MAIGTPQGERDRVLGEGSRARTQRECSLFSRVIGERGGRAHAVGDGPIWQALDDERQ